MEIYSPTPEEKETFKVAQEPVLEWMRGELGDDTVDQFMAALEVGGETGSDTADTQTAVNATSQANITPYLVAIVVLALAVVVLIIKGRKKTETQDS